MGNNIGVGNNKTTKIMKINGEFFKLKTPTKVIDIIKDYPDHILLDSQEFLRFNLRAKPLDFDFELKPKRIYLLFQLPKFPETKFISKNVKSSPHRRVRSGVEESTVKELRMKMMMSKRSVSDLSITTKSTAEDTDQDGGGGAVVGPTRIKLRLPKAQVQRIIKESKDDVEVARRILRLFAALDGVDGVVDVEKDGGGRGEEGDNTVGVEEEEEVEVEVVDNRHCFNLLTMCSPHHRKSYLKLAS